MFNWQICLLSLRQQKLSKIKPHANLRYCANSVNCCIKSQNTLFLSFLTNFFSRSESRLYFNIWFAILCNILGIQEFSMGELTQNILSIFCSSPKCLTGENFSGGEPADPWEAHLHGLTPVSRPAAAIASIAFFVIYNLKWLNYSFKLLCELEIFDYDLLFDSNII